MRASTASARPAPARSTGIQYAALPYRFAGEAVEILLITTRRTKRWIVPKGWPIEGLTPSASAAREALEEAGISGEVQATPIGRFHYTKEFRQRVAVPCRVDVFALKVTRQRKDWDEKESRELKWVSVAEAAQMVEEPELRKLISKFASQIATASARL
jgi:8-oxo-dGTP pyrophosphatase MutT (NUDIX family)